jgi:hypothetical protein
MHLSTGPQTEAAKAITSQNARTHGLSAKMLIVSLDDQPEFDELQSKLLAECAPHGALEEELFRQIVHAQWNLRRCDVAELKLCAETEPVAQGDPSCGQKQSVDPVFSDDPAILRRLDRIQRYRNAHNRAWHRALRELRELQTNRYFLADTGSPRPPLANEMKVLRYLDAHSRIKARDAATEHREADTEFKEWWNRQERSLAETVAAADRENQPAAAEAVASPLAAA